MNAADAGDPTLMHQVDAACQRIAPVWPLKNFVAVNPYDGLSSQSFWQAHEILTRIAGTGLCMPRTYYRRQMARGRITHADVAAALQESGSPWNVADVEDALSQAPSSSKGPWRLVTDVLGELDGQDWSAFVIERISRYCAAYFDQGQALWALPWKKEPLYQGWIQFARLDHSPRMLGVRGMNKALAHWPDTAHGAIVRALQELEVPLASVGDYLYAALLSIGGWAGWTRYLQWQAELQGDHDDSIRDLLAVRMTWDALVYRLFHGDTLKMRWHESLAAVAKPLGSADVGLPVDPILQTALEIGYRRHLVKSLVAPRGGAQNEGQPDAQAVFCIDVRSEVYRRALETVTPRVQTLGFAGFFGILMEYLPFGAIEAQAHLPVLFKPAYRVSESLGPANGPQAAKLIARRHTRMRIAKTWKTFKTSASSTFAFVEAAGLWWAWKLVSDTMGWTRPVPPPDRVGLSATQSQRVVPDLTMDSEGIPEADRPVVAESVLRNMGLFKDFARLILFIGHGSTTVNNPQASGLDCGACGGQSGEASARIAAALLNDPLTRRGLQQKGIDIPPETYFVAGLHDTTTDEVRLFALEEVPPSHADDVNQLRRWLDAAGQVTRMERAHGLGMADRPAPILYQGMRRRARDWAQVRPEWALAGNAAFIAAPRTRTAHANLAGRVFLHDYDWHHDPDFGTLQLIMTAPLIVAHWINMQYYGSVVDNRRLGSGNKVLHNVVGGSVGVLEGNGGDLRGGLAWQSLHDGDDWVHEPMRLTVLIEAPPGAIDAIIARHEKVRQLVDNAWIHLFQIDEDGHLHRRDPDQRWRRY